MSKVVWYRVKNGNKEEIPEPESTLGVAKLLNDGFVVTKVIEDGNYTRIETLSPRTFEEYKKAGGV